MPASLIRSAALEAFPALVTDLGGDWELLFERAKISPDVTSRPTTFVSTVSFVRLLEYAAGALECPDFGVRLSDRQSMGMFGPLAVAMRNSATLGEALACCSRYMFIHTPALNIRVHPATDAGSVLIEMQINLDRRQRAVQAMELGLNSVKHMLRRLSAGRTVARAVTFRHEPVDQPGNYRRRFGPRVLFGAEVDAIEIAASELDRAIGGSRAELRGLAENYLELHRKQPQTSFAQQVTEIVSESIGAGVSSCEEIARALALHPRTLQRRLREEGTTFELLKDEARAALAREYLVQRDLPLAQTAALLDYSEQSAFTRSCKRWFGRTPRQMRAELLEGAASVAELDVSPAPSLEARGVARARPGHSSRSFPRG